MNKEDTPKIESNKGEQLPKERTCTIGDKATKITIRNLENEPMTPKEQAANDEAAIRNRGFSGRSRYDFGSRHTNGHNSFLGVDAAYRGTDRPRN